MGVTLVHLQRGVKTGTVNPGADSGPGSSIADRAVAQAPLRAAFGGCGGDPESPEPLDWSIRSGVAAVLQPRLIAPAWSATLTC